MVEPLRRIAVLIDSDNVMPFSIEKILEMISKCGELRIRRAYGDWTTGNMSGWKDVERSCSVQLIQQSRYIKGKNATDMAMLIDAMDILYSGKIDTFCLVSSDSDFTPLAIRLRNAGRQVIGVGSVQTNEVFINACTEFININSLFVEAEDNPEVLKRAFAPTTNAKKTSPVSLLKKAYQEATAQEDGWVLLTQLGQSLHQLDAGFKPNRYGHSKLGKLIRAYPDLFEVKGNHPRVYVKLKS